MTIFIYKNREDFRNCMGLRGKCGNNMQRHLPACHPFQLPQICSYFEFLLNCRLLQKCSNTVVQPGEWFGRLKHHPPYFYILHMYVHTHQHILKEPNFYVTQERKKKLCFNAKRQLGPTPRLSPERKSAPLDTKYSQEFYSPDKHTCTANCICTKGRRSAHRSH